MFLDAGRPKGLVMLLLVGAMYNTGIIFHSMMGKDSFIFHSAIDNSRTEEMLSSPSFNIAVVTLQNSTESGTTPGYTYKYKYKYKYHSRAQHVDEQKESTTKKLLPEEPRNIETTLYLNATKLLQSGHFDRVARSIARGYLVKSTQVCSLNFPVRFSKLNNRVPQIYKDPIEGLYYNKVPKTASSTLAGINQRIAFRWGHRIYAPKDDATTIFTKRNTSCSHKEAHILGAGKYYRNRVAEKSFLWGSLRNPASRALSRIFFDHISQLGSPRDDETVLKFLKNDYNPQNGIVSKGKGGFQLQYLTLENNMREWYAWDKRFPTVVKRPDIVKERVEHLINNYDIIVLTERIDESIVALQLLLGLRVGDVLSTSAKMGGGYYYDKEKRSCIPIQKTRRSAAVQEYLESDEWQAVNYGDYLLYAAANQSLDLTIELLGRGRFDEALRLYRQAQQVVDQECSSQTHFPCSKNGTAQWKLSKSDCYSDDEGCGYSCVDRLVQERGW